MYPDLYKGLNLKLEGLTAYNSPLISFDGKIVVLKSQIRLLVQAGSEVVEVNFIVVDAYYPYTTIVERPCFFHSTFEGEISICGLDRRACLESILG